MPSDLYLLAKKEKEKEQTYTIRILPSQLNLCRVASYAEDRPLNWVIQHAINIYLAEHHQEITSQLAKMEEWAKESPEIAKKLAKIKENIPSTDE